MTLAATEGSALAGSHPPAVLVHCSLGVNRSPTLVLAFLVMKGLSLRQAYRQVLRTRPHIDPLPGYRDALMRYETEVRRRASSVARSELFAMHFSELEEE